MSLKDGILLLQPGRLRLASFAAVFAATRCLTLVLARRASVWKGAGPPISAKQARSHFTRTEKGMFNFSTTQGCSSNGVGAGLAFVLLVSQFANQSGVGV